MSGFSDSNVGDRSVSGVKNPIPVRESPAESIEAKKNIRTTHGSRDMANLSLAFFGKWDIPPASTLRPIASGRAVGHIPNIQNVTTQLMLRRLVYNMSIMM